MYTDLWFSFNSFNIHTPSSDSSILIWCLVRNEPVIFIEEFFLHVSIKEWLQGSIKCPDIPYLCSPIMPNFSLHCVFTKAVHVCVCVCSQSFRRMVS